MVCLKKVKLGESAAGEKCRWTKKCWEFDGNIGYLCRVIFRMAECATRFTMLSLLWVAGGGYLFSIFLGVVVIFSCCLGFLSNDSEGFVCVFLSLYVRAVIFGCLRHKKRKTLSHK